MTTNRAVTAAGIAVLAAYACSWILMANAPYDTALRESARSAMSVCIMLNLVWFLTSVIVVARRWRDLPRVFWTAFVLNTSLVTMLAIDFAKSQ